MFAKIVEKFRSRILLALQTTANAAEAYANPTAGVMGISVRALATMGNAADLTLSLKYADDATGTNSNAFPVNVPIYVNGVREAVDAKSYAITPATGNFIVDFCIDPGLIPEGKYVGVSYANSNAGNLLTTMIIEDVAYKPTAT